MTKWHHDENWRTALFVGGNIDFVGDMGGEVILVSVISQYDLIHRQINGLVWQWTSGWLKAAVKENVHKEIADLYITA